MTKYTTCELSGQSPFLYNTTTKKHPASIYPALERRQPGGRECTHLTMKSNSVLTSMIIPRKVEVAPCTTGAKVCSVAIITRRFRLPMEVTKPCGVPKKTVS